MQVVVVASFVHLDPIPLLKVFGRALEYQRKFAIFCNFWLLTLC